MNNNNKNYSKFLAFVYLFSLHFKFTILLCLYCTPGIKREAFHRSKLQPMKWKKMGIAQTTDTLLHHKMHLITGRFLNYKCKYEIKLYLWLCACFIWSALMIWRVVFMVFDVLIPLQEWMWLTQRRDARDTRKRELNIIVTIRKRTISIIYSGGNIWAVSPRPLLALLFIDPLK